MSGDTTMREVEVSPAFPDVFVIWRGIVWRPWLVLTLTLLGTAVTVSIAWTLPPVYQSTARILVESQQIPSALAQSTVTASAAERLAVIEQRLMTRENLLDVSRRLGLFSRRPDLSPTEIVDRMRAATRIESTSFNANPRYRGPTQVSAFSISFEADDARKVTRAANEFAALVIEQNLEARSARADETHAFFKVEVERLAAKLGTLETEIADYKSRNKVHLPETLKVRAAELARLKQQLVQRQKRIEQLSLRSASTTNVALRETGPQRTGQIELLRRQQRATEERILGLQAAIDETMKIELRLSGMMRELGHLQLQQKEAVRKANAAATGAKLEDSRQAERFEVIERAEVPEAPIAPHREIIVIGGALASFLLVACLAGLLEWLNRMVRTRHDCHRLLGMRPVAVIPRVSTPREILRGRLVLTAAVCGPLLVIGIAAWVSIPFSDLPPISSLDWRNVVGVVGSVPESIDVTRGG